MNKIRWGVLGVAKIATAKVIPAMQAAARRRTSWRSRRAIGAKRRIGAAADLGIARAHGSYEALLDDPDIDAVYIPLPNHLHVPWAIRAVERRQARALREADRAERGRGAGLLEVRDRTGVRMQEAFMVRTHPQWLARERGAQRPSLARLRSIAGYFSYYNDDAVEHPEHRRSSAAAA